MALVVNTFFGAMQVLVFYAIHMAIQLQQLC
jgi:hypothetical protein